MVPNRFGAMAPHPAFAMKKQSEAQLGFAATALGLSPKGRSALKREAAPIDDTPLPETAKASAF
jgi:phage terminase small subunit